MLVEEKEVKTKFKKVKFLLNFSPTEFSLNFFY